LDLIKILYQLIKKQNTLVLGSTHLVGEKKVEEDRSETTSIQRHTKPIILPIKLQVYEPSRYLPQREKYSFTRGLHKDSSLFVHRKRMGVRKKREDLGPL
jgi:hypothetical protein